MVSNLSAKNKYSTSKKVGKSSTTWEVVEDNNLQEAELENYKVNTVYRLNCYTTGMYLGIGCVFAKINGKWKIIDFQPAG